MAPKVSFWGTVAGLWTALKLKKEWDDYSEVATEEEAERGRIRLPNTPALNGQEEDEVSLLDPNSRRKVKGKARACCMCFGVDCSLFWKAFGIVACLWIVYVFLSGVQWMITPTPTGLEKMPAFGTSLGCENTRFFYNDLPQGHSISVPVSTDYHDHSIKLAGNGVGTLTVTAAPKGAKEVTYSVVMRGSDQKTVNRASFEIEDPDTNGEGRALRFNTPAIPQDELASGAICVRFDVTMSVPSNVQLLRIASKTLLHVKFAEDSRLELKDLSVVLFKLDDKNIIIPSPNVFSDAITFEVFRGWIVGETTISKTTSVTTQRGAGVTNLKVYQAAPEDPLKPETSTLRTTTGIGRTDITYIANPTKRPIQSIHHSSMNGDVYLNYKQAMFDGKIAMDSKSYTVAGGAPIASRERMDGDDKVLRKEGKWTHVGGSGEGADRLSVFSKGWTGLYL